MCLIDCTYKTSAYDMPLLALAVRTNVGFYYAATAVLTAESTSQVTAALRCVKDANPDWRPVAFVTDFNEAQISAIGTVFPG